MDYRSDKGSITNHDHAVTQMGSDSFSYDANGNQTARSVGGNSYTLSYDAEYHLVSRTKIVQPRLCRTKIVQVTPGRRPRVARLVGVSGAVTASFVYDGDGNRVQGTIGGVTTADEGNIIGSTSLYICNGRYHRDVYRISW